MSDATNPFANQANTTYPQSQTYVWPSPYCTCPRCPCCGKPYAPAPAWYQPYVQPYWILGAQTWCAGNQQAAGMGNGNR